MKLSYLVYNLSMLQVKNLTFSVGPARKRVLILDGVSLKIKPSEFVVITGPNGSGKSTLARLIMGLEKASSGQIIFDKTDITAENMTERARRGLAFAFQQPPYFKGLTVKDLLQISATGQETFLEDGGIDYGKLLKDVGLDESYLEREVDNSLSGGELKRVEIASALARGAKLTIFDEPEAGIDVWSFEKLVQIFKRFREKNPERAMMVISHQRRLMKQADRLIILKGGKIVAEGSPNKILPLLQERDG